MNKCIELEFPFDGRRKATIITNNKVICEELANNPDVEIIIKVVRHPLIKESACWRDEKTGRIISRSEAMK